MSVTQEYEERKVKFKRIDPKNNKVIASGEFPSRRPISPVTVLDHTRIAAMQSLLVIRDVGLGDVMMLQPGLRAFKQQHPQIDITLATKKWIGDYLRRDVPYLKAVIDMDTELELHEYDDTLDLRHFPERSRYRAEISRTEIFALSMGMRKEDIHDWHLPKLHNEEEMATVQQELAPYPHPWFVVGPYSSSPIRTFPEKLVHIITKQLSDIGTVIYHGLSEVERDHFAPHVKHHFLGRALGVNAALYAAADLAVVADSGQLHMAQSAQLYSNEHKPKIVVFFGCSAPELRMLPGVRYWAHRPQELECFPCEHGPKSRSCKIACLNDVTSRDIYYALQSLGVVRPEI